MTDRDLDKYLGYLRNAIRDHEDRDRKLMMAIDNGALRGPFAEALIAELEQFSARYLNPKTRGRPAPKVRDSIICRAIADLRNDFGMNRDDAVIAVGQCADLSFDRVDKICKRGGRKFAIDDPSAAG